MARVRLKTPEQVAAMRRAGLVVAAALDAAAQAARPGASTLDVDAAAARVIRERGATPSFLGYHGYPATVCVSVNDEVVHGIPGPRLLAPGDVVSIDCGAIVDGWHGDAARSLVLGPADAADLALVAATEHAMWAGIAALARHGRVGDVGEAVEAAAGGYGIVEEYVGHGVGTAMHEEPDVPNYVCDDRGPRVRSGLCLAVEPMLVRGSAAVRELADGWTAVTVDGSRAAHWEHTVAVLDEGLWVLTAADGGASGLAPFGVAAGGPAGR